MIDYLLRFPSEAAARAALHDLMVEDEWPAEFLPVALVLEDAVYGEAGGDGSPTIISERATAPGFWLLTILPEQVAQVAAIERETGLLLAGGDALVGARLDPVWAGAQPTIRTE